jgi:uncharacterized protein (UPF0276 family)
MPALAPALGRRALPAALGVGMVYTPRLDAVIDEASGLIDVIEVEPQTLWRRGAGEGERYTVDHVLLERLSSRSCRKVLHGVGFPVGSVRPPSPAQIPPLLEMIDALAPAWMSEHLAFNRMVSGGATIDAGFLLPPRQTQAGVAGAIASIRSVADRLPIPFAVENGISYLRTRPDEMDDGAYVAAVVDGADCGLVLDLHNAFANARNGRQPLDRFLAEIPLERVWELHLAGGMDYRGYWLDAHSGVIDAPVIEIARDIIPDLPNLKAMIFEITPSFLDVVETATILRQLEMLHDLWRLRCGAPARHGARVAVRPRASPTQLAGDIPSPEQWEDTLGALVLDRAADGTLAQEISADPGLHIFRHLVAEFRASTVIGTLPFSGRLMLMTLGTERFEQLLADFWRTSPPEAFGSREARGFAGYAATLELDLPLLDQLLAYDVAVVAALTENARASVRFRHDPRLMLASLADHRVPQNLPDGEFFADISPEGITFRAAGAETGDTSMALRV